MTVLIGLSILIPYFYFWGMVIRLALKPAQLQPITSSLPEITVVCSIRNEESLLPHFLKNIEQLESEKTKLFYYILVNDQSTDHSSEILNEFFNRVEFSDRVSILETSPDKSGKKQALNLAFMHIQTDWAFVTDADCNSISNFKINYLFQQTQKNGSKAAFGPIIYTGNTTFLQSYQILENSALMALGSFQSNRNNKTMGNAANMLVHTGSFNEINPYRKNIHVAGGDDIFLIEAFTQASLTIETISNPEIAVYTPVLVTWPQLWHQRIRWAQKSRFQAKKNTQNSQILMVLFFLLLWIITIYYLNFAHYVEFGILWGAKIFFDFFLLDQINLFYSQKTTVSNKILSSVFQPIFIPIIAFAQFVSKVHWKGRRS